MADNEQELHERLATAVLTHGWQSKEVDAALAECPDAECRECSWIACPHADPLHFHHDGCPSCEQTEDGQRG